MPARPIVERLTFRRAPLAAAALWLALGIAFAHWQRARDIFTPTVELFAALFLLVLIALLALRHTARLASLPVAAMWLVLGMGAFAWQPGPPYPAALLPYADNLSRTVQARITRIRPAPATPEQDLDAVPAWELTEETASGSAHPLSVDLALDAIEDVTPDRSTMVPISGGVRVAVYDAGALNLGCGDRVELPLRLKPPQRFRDPGAFQVADYLLTQGIALDSSVAASRIRLVGASPPGFRCRLFAAQAWAATRLSRFTQSAANRQLPVSLRLSSPDALMLNAMLFGDRTGLSHSLRLGFERTGSFHLFVVSGLHIALLAGGVFWILRRVHAPPWLATLMTIAAASAYTALTGFGQPAQRSLAMTSVYLLARLLYRDRDPLNALGAAVLALLVWAPASLFDAGFQMTALAIVAIAGIAVPLGRQTFLRYALVVDDVFQPPHSRFAPREMQLRVMLELWGSAFAALFGKRARRLPARLFWILLWGCELALIATVAELVMVLPMALYFHRAAVFALPANMVVIPVIAVLAPAAIATFVCSLIGSWLAVIPGALTAALLHAIAWTIQRLSHLAVADVRVPGPAWWVAVLAVAGWFGCCWAVRRGRWGALATALALPLLAALVLWPEPAQVTPAALEITAIDVGQGDSLLAVSPAGRSMLIDAGGPTGRSGPAEIVANFDVGEEVVSPYLWSRRIRRLDVVVLSHAHTDHMGGMPAVLENFRPRELWVGIDPHSELYGALLAEAARLGIVVRRLHAGDQLPWGGVQVSVLSPQPAYSNPSAPKNDDSLVLELRFGKASALLEGDAEAPSEQSMLAAGRVHPVTLLKVAHHGSRTSTTQAFLDAAAPQDAVISVGRRNTFGHPRPEIVGRLAAESAHVFRTDEFGLTTFLLTADGGIREAVNQTPLPAHTRTVGGPPGKKQIPAE
jgi:competence protein ComEC